MSVHRGEVLLSLVMRLMVIPDEECWAVFEGTTVNEESRRSIAINDPDLAELADMWGLRIF
ncbi:hypothetical protein BKG69_15880 [Mycobacteroides chelonae]|uniref:hypothetical protein n=1 Tax=Mycobacteroides chelonae TaxID=1774 RepID=UPI0008AA4D6A|nr:hypothetical protein [Mycobacteroides chelonae]OHT78125.1 hypothetical protein BKG69_15880 [Mycobacteroides chelonae]